MPDDDIKSAATHMLLSRIIDLWISDKPVEQKTEMMNYIVNQMNAWLEWKYGEREPRADPLPPLPTERPACLVKGNAIDSRIWTAMQNEPYVSIKEMAKQSDQVLLRIVNFGRKSLKRLRELAQQEFEEEMNRNDESHRDSERPPDADAGVEL